MRLSDTQFKVLENVVDTNNLSRWAAGKEYIPLPTLSCDIQTIFANFDIPKKAQILPQDIRIENYKKSKIVDLSSTLTEPCPEWRGFIFYFSYENTIFGVFDRFKRRGYLHLSASQPLSGWAFAFLFRNFGARAGTKAAPP